MKRHVIAAAALLAAVLTYEALPGSEAGLLSASAIRPQEAAAHVGEYAQIEGIAHVHVKSSATFIDMGGDYPFHAFQGWSFPEQQLLLGI